MDNNRHVDERTWQAGTQKNEAQCKIRFARRVKVIDGGIQAVFDNHPLHLIAQLLAIMDEIDGLFIRHNFVSAGVGVPASPSEQIAQVSSVPYQE